MNTIDQIEASIEKLSVTLDCLRASTASMDLSTVATDVLKHCRVLRADSGMGFYVLEDPEGMPADARVDFLYHPTYLAAAILMLVWLEDSSIIRGISGGCVKMAEVLYGCTGRGLHGHGYEAYEGLVEALSILCRGRVRTFLAKEADNHPEFANCVRTGMKDVHALAGGTLQGDWNKSNTLVAAAKQLVSDWENFH